MHIIIIKKFVPKRRLKINVNIYALTILFYYTIKYKASLLIFFKKGYKIKKFLIIRKKQTIGLQNLRFKN
jgi:hypothetical protein